MEFRELSAFKPSGNGNIIVHELSCSNCGNTCEYLFVPYSYCPYCGKKATVIFERHIACMEEEPHEH